MGLFLQGGSTYLHITLFVLERTGVKQIDLRDSPVRREDPRRIPLDKDGGDYPRSIHSTDNLLKCNILQTTSSTLTFYRDSNLL